VDSIISKYEEEGWRIINYEDYYISPGLIDLNVKFNGPWEGVINGTMSSLAGGVTMVVVGENLYELPEDEAPKFFCDIGRTALITDENAH
jgi:dihydroorotase-like cyclic amidohydrolase